MSSADGALHTVWAAVWPSSMCGDWGFQGFSVVFPPSSGISLSFIIPWEAIMKRWPWLIRCLAVILGFFLHGQSVFGYTALLHSTPNACLGLLRLCVLLGWACCIALCAVKWDALAFTFKHGHVLFVCYYDKNRKPWAEISGSELNCIPLFLISLFSSVVVCPLPGSPNCALSSGPSW